MSRILFTVLSLLLLAAVMAANWVEMEANARKFTTKAVEEVEADKGLTKVCTFHLIGKNADTLEKYVAESSDPRSVNYGKHLTKEQLQEMTSDTEGLAKITEYLSINGATVIKHTASSVTAEASIGSWEQLLHTTFYSVPNPTLGGPDSRSTSQAPVLHLARQYWLPDSIAPHVRMVAGTIQLPIELSKGPVMRG
ncbi:Pro-kumamolisin, activation domain-containing protein, partial [Ochromonadaceae sp. CCMP2298]